MPSNFIQWNPSQANQESDTTYAADTLRSGGATSPSIFPSSTANKLFYQLSTFVAGLAQSLSNKGYAVSDASLSTLTSVLASVMTSADMAPYAPLASPSLSGTPTASTPAAGDNSTRIATTAWTVASFATMAFLATTYATVAWVLGNFARIISPSFTGNPTAPTPATSDASPSLATTAFVKAQNYQTALGFQPVQQGGGAGQLGNKLYLGWNGSALALQVDTSNIGTLPTQAYVDQADALLTPLASFVHGVSGSSGYVKLPNGLMMQFGEVGIGTATVVTMATAFATPSVYAITATNVGPGNGTMNARTIGFTYLNPSQFTAWSYDASGAPANTNISYLAIGW